MKKIVLITVLAVASATISLAQEQGKMWGMEECMEYAVMNSHAVRKAQFAHNTTQAEYAGAIASFFPSLNVTSAAEYNYGRSINPETNTYIETTTFNNYYQGRASLPLFSGGQLVNGWRKARVGRQSGMNDIQKAKDDLALKVMQAFIDVVYYEGLMNFAAEKLEQSRQNLHKISRQEELGLKGKADVVQIEAEVAGDDYLYTHQQNLYNTAMSTLKETMNYPFDQELTVDTQLNEQTYAPAIESVEDIYDFATETNPTALKAGYDVKVSRMQQLIERGELFPSISLYAGVSTSYYENLKAETDPPAFKSQFKNNMGEYFGVQVSFPLFDRLSRITNVRRANNNLRIAMETQSEVLRQLQTTIEKAVLDREGYAKETIQMEKKCAADDFSYQVTLRKFEEGLMSPLDLRTSANILIESKANLLQRQLLYVLKCKEVDYYKGIPLVDIK